MDPKRSPRPFLRKITKSCPGAARASSCSSSRSSCTDPGTQPQTGPIAPVRCSSAVTTAARFYTCPPVSAQRRLQRAQLAATCRAPAPNAASVLRPRLHGHRNKSNRTRRPHYAMTRLQRAQLAATCQAPAPNAASVQGGRGRRGNPTPAPGVAVSVSVRTRAQAAHAQVTPVTPGWTLQGTGTTVNTMIRTPSPRRKGKDLDH
jgi:hypothetical protein